MKCEELRSLGREELLAKKGELQKELFNLRYQHHTAQLENTAKLKDVRKNIARIETVLAGIK